MCTITSLLTGALVKESARNLSRGTIETNHWLSRQRSKSFRVEHGRRELAIIEASYHHHGVNQSSNQAIKQSIEPSIFHCVEALEGEEATAREWTGDNGVPLVVEPAVSSVKLFLRILSCRASSPVVTSSGSIKLSRM